MKNITKTTYTIIVSALLCSCNLFRTSQQDISEEQLVINIPSKQNSIEKAKLQ